MTPQSLNDKGAGNPELFLVLNAFVSFHRRVRLIDGCQGFAMPPSFKGPDGGEVFLDEIGCHEDAAAAAIRNVTRRKYEKAAEHAASFLGEVYDATPEELQAWLDDVLPPDEPAKCLDNDLPRAMSPDGDGAADGQSALPNATDGDVREGAPVDRAASEEGKEGAI